MLLGEEATWVFFPQSLLPPLKVPSLTSWNFCSNAASFTRRLFSLSSATFLFCSHCTRDISFITPLMLASQIRDCIFLFSFFSYWAMYTSWIWECLFLSFSVFLNFNFPPTFRKQFPISITCIYTICQLHRD